MTVFTELLAGISLFGLYNNILNINHIMPKTKEIIMYKSYFGRIYIMLNKKNLKQ